MKDLFTKNDKYLHVTKIIFYIFIILLGLISFIGGIVLMALELIVAGLPLLICGLIATFITYVAGRLVFSYLVDVKAIRNKLYGYGNDELNRFYGIGNYSDYPEEGGRASDDASDTAAKLTELKKAHDCGALTDEEYEEQKQRILKG